MVNWSASGTIAILLTLPELGSLNLVQIHLDYATDV